MNAPTVPVYEFEGFRLDPAKRILSRNGATIPLTPRVFETLLFLVQHRGTVLDKERLMEAVWPDSIVEENNLTQNISTLRRVFGETPGSHRFIVTVPGRGYRFVAEVAEHGGNGVAETSAQPRPEHAFAEAPTTAVGASARRQRTIRVPVIAGIVVAAATALVLGAFLVGRFERVQPASTSPAPAPVPASQRAAKSIAVLPFESLSTDPDNVFFAAGIQDEILSNLAKVSDLKVISRTSANLYKTGSPRNAREIGEQLGVAHLLEGSVQRVGDRVRVHAQLIDTRTDAHVWAQSYDRSLADVFAIQAEIAQTIAGQLQARILPPEQAAIAQPATTDLKAAALFTRASSAKNSDPQGLLDSVRLLEDAVAIDPKFVVAYCKIAHAHMDLYMGGYDHSPARRDLANAAIERAAAVQPDAGQVHVARGRYWLHGFRDYDRARAELDLARRTLPNEPLIYFWGVSMDRRQGRWSEAIRNGERALEIDPRNTELLTTAAGTYERLRRYPEAAQLYERAIAVAPQEPFPRLCAGMLELLHRGDLKRLRAELDGRVAARWANDPLVLENLFTCALLERDRTAVDLVVATMPPEGMFTGGVWPREWFTGYAARAFNDHETARAAFTKARQILDEVVREQSDYSIAWSVLGRIDAALGQKEQATAEARRACELLPLSKDEWYGVSPIRALAWTYAWTGEVDLACEQLESLERTGGIHYGELKLNPEWDPLRGHSRFEQIIARLAPKDGPM